MAPRLTGEVATGELDAAAAALAAPAAAHPDGPLAAPYRQLQAMAASLRQSLGADADKPVEILRDTERAGVLRAHAAALRTQAFVQSCAACVGADAAATASAFASGIDRLIGAGTTARLLPVIDTVETIDRQPLFALREGGKLQGLALNGANLADTQCANPKVTATDAAGNRLSTQPVLGGVLPTRLELHWPQAGTLPPGLVVLHVVPQHKLFLLGCSTLPEATATFMVASPLHLTVDYVLTAQCAGSKVALGKGTMPALDGYGRTVQRRIDTTACRSPESYTVSAMVDLGEAGHSTVGPFTQGADASITAGLPGGLSLSWNPAVQTLFVRSGASPCKGIH